MSKAQVVAAEQQAVINQLQRIFQIFKASEGTIRPHFILTGESGVGKSHTVEYLATSHKLGYYELNAAALTKEGTSGNSVSKALSVLLNRTSGPIVIFVDEFDKLFISGNNNSDLAHETTNGVQNEFLKVLEAGTASVFGDYGKYINVAVDDALFVFAGAFNGEADVTLDRLRDFGVKTEFLGRVGLVYGLPRLSLDSLAYILEQSPLLESYLQLFPDVDKDDVVKAVMAEVKEVYSENTLGIRLLNTMLHQYFVNDGEIPKRAAEVSAFHETLSLSKKRSPLAVRR